MGLLDSYLAWILEASLRGSLLGLCILILQFILGQLFRLPAQWRYALWIPFLGVLCAPLLPRSPLSFEAWTASLQIERMVRRSTDLLSLRFPQTPPTTPALQAPSPGNAPQTAALSTPPAKPNVLSRAGLLGLLLLSGGLLSAALSAANYQRTLRRIRQHSAPVEIELLDLLQEATRQCGLKRIPLTLLSESVRSPAVTGFKEPVILLPRGFLKDHSLQEAHFVLLHECTHIRRHDVLANWMLSLLQALHWFNPLLHFFFRRIRSDRELACDAAVIQHLSEDHRTDYGFALLRFEGCLEPHGPNRGLIGLFERASGIRARISAIANYRNPNPRWLFAGWAVLSLLCLIGATKRSSAPPDFWYELWSVQDPNAEQYLQESVGVRKYQEWQSDRVSYWGTATNGAEASLTFRFPFAAPTRDLQLHAKLAAFNFRGGGGQGRGECSLWASANGTQWLPLLQNPVPETIDSYRDFEGTLPRALCGSRELWV
jgi:bla regulator protein BlaR1